MRTLINQIPVLFYHSIAFKKEPRWVKNFLTIDLPFFEDFLRYLHKRKYESVDLYYYINAKKNQTLDTKKKICLTFDDGFLDNWVFVYPLLKKYGFTATIFINPLNIDNTPIVRRTLEDCWKGSIALNELETTGFLTWDEILLMQNSGIFNFQSHTLSHTKYFISDQIIDFHRPSSVYVYPIFNQFPDFAKNYFTNREYEKQLPFGYPIFREASSIIAKKVDISDDFIKKAITLYNISTQNGLNYKESLKKLIELRNEFLLKNPIIVKTEHENDYINRVTYELAESKRIIESKLNNQVHFCCWPHGENTPEVHELALKLGYIATTIGKLNVDPLDSSRIYRFALDPFSNNRLLSLMRSVIELHAYEGIQPFLFLKLIYYKIKGY